MKITGLEVENYQAIREVEIRPGDRALLIVGGRNRQGKSSLLSALEVAFGGKRAAGPEPVRHGEDRARIHVELDDGELVIDRTIGTDGRHRLEVRQAGERQRKGQAVLDALIGARFLDPLQFLRASAKEQRELLLQVARIELDLDQVAAEREQAYAARTTINRDLKRREAELANLPRADVAAEAIDVAATVRELRKLHDLQAQRGRMNEIAREQEDIEEKISQLRERYDALGAEWKHLQRTAVDEADLQGKIAAAEQELEHAEEHNRRAAQAEQARQRREQLRADVASIRRDSAELTKRIEDLDRRKAEALQAAEMPIAGLEVADDHVAYNGAPFSQAADSEQLQAALAIAAALSPTVRDVWIRDGSLLDGDSLDAVRRFAEERGCRVWIERVGDGDDGAVVIEDGTVRP